MVSKNSIVQTPNIKTVQLLFLKNSFQGKRGERPDQTIDAEQDMLGLQSNPQQTESSQETQRR